MSQKTIIFILSAPEGGGKTLSESLESYISAGSPPHAGNNTADLTNFIDDLTGHMGINAHRPAIVEEDQQTGPALRAQRLLARKILFSLPSTSFPLVCHHDANPLLIPFWKATLEDTDFKAEFVLLNSNPLQVVDKLTEKAVEEKELKQETPQNPDNTFSSDISSNDVSSSDASQWVILWAQSILHSLNYGGKHIVPVSYQHFLSNPTKTIQSILSHLSLDVHKGSNTELERKHINKAIQTITTPFMSDLAYTSKDVMQYHAFPDFIKTLYKTLNDRNIDNPEHKKLKPALGDVLAPYEEFSFLLKKVVDVETNSTTLQQKIESNIAEIKAVETKSLQFEEMVSALTRAKEGLDNDKQHLSEELESLRGELSQLQQSNNEKLGVLSEENQSLSLTIEDNEQSIANLQKLLETNRAQFEKKNQTLTIENAQLIEKDKATQALLEQVEKERKHDGHRFNIERASLLKEHRAREKQQQALLDKFLAKDEEENPSYQNTINDANPDSVTTTAAQQLQIDTLEQQRLTLEIENRALLERARVTEQKLSDQDSSMAHYMLESDSAKQEIRAIKSSTSWKASAPLRGAKKLVKNPKAGITSGAKRSARLVWRTIPLPKRGKTLLVGGLFTTLPFVFSRTASYQNWKSGRQNNNRQIKSRDKKLKKNKQDDDHPGGTKPSNTALDPLANGLDTYVPLTAKPNAESLQTKAPIQAKAKAIAFYLPQFHEIPENDEWWGPGFTEWTNVKKATPQYDGHYQPHQPGELGHYHLLNDEKIFHRQTELAKLHGIAGFAFYFYWFAGKRLLEAPLQRYLKDTSIDFPFCLCWANENWSRRWNGDESSILISQNHSPEDDFNFISYLAQYLRDPRYIKIDGKPVILVYRPSTLPSARETAQRWRRWCRENGIGEIYLAYTQSFDKISPNLIDFDAAIEFPPNNHGLIGTPDLLKQKNADFTGKLFDWNDLVERSENYPQVPYPIFRGVTPSWDNTARRGNAGTILLNSQPSEYYKWLKNAISDTHARFSNPDEQLIFINAWNEWAEGAHLEPDEKYGYAWLEASRRALIEPPTPEPTLSQPTQNTDKSSNQVEMTEKKILIVTHDLYRHGAQFLSLNFARVLKENYGFDVHIIAGKDGPLKRHFEHYGTVTIIEHDEDEKTRTHKLSNIKKLGYTQAFVNSSASGWISPYLKTHNIKFIALVHEMRSIVKSMKLEKNLQAFKDHAIRTIFPASIVQNQATQFIEASNWVDSKILPQGIYKQDGYNDAAERQQARNNILKTHNIPDTAFITLGVGFADHRKGIDIFLNWAISTINHDPNCHFIWVGDIAQDMQTLVDEALEKAGRARSNIHLTGFQSQTQAYYLASDLFALTSREDPFPSTALESLNAATAVIMIKGCGGIEDIAGNEFVTALENDHTDVFLDTIKPYLENRSLAHQQGLTALDYVREHFGFVSYVGDLLEELGVTMPSVSVMIPNYNYEMHLDKRIKSVLEQTNPPREIIFLDDASSDHSIEKARQHLSNSGINHRMILNQKNSGNVFLQWEKGINLAKYPISWIAEADDYADEKFIETLTPFFTSPQTVIAYSQSRQIDGQGKIIAPDYHLYVQDISPTKWTKSFEGSGPSEVAEGLNVKNTIPNVSGVLFQTTSLQNIFKKGVDFKKNFRAAGDWYIYVNLLREGTLCYEATPLNYHRRHENSVTISQFKISDLKEIADMQDYIMHEFSLGASHKKAAQAYLQHLISHFKMQEDYSPDQLATAIKGDGTHLRH